jgi:AcrR family transcriptional regulator
VRAELTEEIKRTARRHLAERGAANLSLRSVARDVGLVSSALYRYFPSRDALLTALIIDAYDSLGKAVEEAEGGADRADLLARHRAACHGVRDWALTHPHEYALTYGSPVPGYVAPQDTVGPASRPSNVLVGILVDGVAAGVLRPQPGDWLDPPVRAEMRSMLQTWRIDVPPTVLARGLIAWTNLFGAVSFEVFGRLTAIIDDRRAWFDHQVRAMAILVGLRP